MSGTDCTFNTNSIAFIERLCIETGITGILKQLAKVDGSLEISLTSECIGPVISSDANIFLIERNALAQSGSRAEITVNIKNFDEVCSEAQITNTMSDLPGPYFHSTLEPLTFNSSTIVSLLQISDLTCFNETFKLDDISVQFTDGVGFSSFSADEDTGEEALRIFARDLDETRFSIGTPVTVLFRFDLIDRADPELNFMLPTNFLYPKFELIKCGFNTATLLDPKIESVKYVFAGIEDGQPTEE